MSDHQDEVPASANELRALEAIITSMEEVTPEARRRILVYVMDCFDIDRNDL